MSPSHPTASQTRIAKPLDHRFWLYHFWIPAIIGAIILSLFEIFPIDLAFADYLYHLEGDSWVLRKNWFAYGIMHHRGKQVLITFGVFLIASYFASFKLERLKPWRWSLGVTVLGIIILPSISAELKHFSGVPCPWSLDIYGGFNTYMHNYQHIFGEKVGSCFPAGHASGGYSLLILYLAFWPFVNSRPYLLLLPGLIVGLSFGLAQQFRGAHFISHDLWTIAICWFGGLAILKLAYKFRPPR